MLGGAGASSSEVVCDRPIHGLRCAAFRHLAGCNAEEVVRAGTAEAGKALVSPASRTNFRQVRATQRAHFGFRPVSLLKRTKAPRSPPWNSRGVLPRAITNRIRPGSLLDCWAVCMVPSAHCHASSAGIGVSFSPDLLASASRICVQLTREQTELGIEGLPFFCVI